MTVANVYTSLKPAAGHAVFGLQVAIENWLKAWFRYGTQEVFHFLVAETAEWNQIQEIAESVGLDHTRLAMLDRRYVRENFAQFTTIFRLDPDPRQLLWQRSMLSGHGFNFCGLAHAVSGMGAGKMLEQYCLGPSERTDVIVCPSRAVRSAIQSFWDLYSDYLHQRFGTHFKCLVQLPLIPLGVDTENLRDISTPAKRKQQRQALGLTESDTVLLWVGRLSFALKAHPLAMFQAAERAAEITGEKIHLIMIGYFMPAESEAQFKKLASDFCSQVKVIFVANNDPRFPDGLWAAGDIFLSLIDNIQESFGLTPIEAMAAGLPRVISDWDGYRDCVEQGEDGFLVRTMQPPPGSGRELSELLLNGNNMYGGFLAKSALMVSVDQDMATEAIALLVRDKNKRKEMGEKARTRALATYDWKHIIPAHEALWEEMAARRRKDKIGESSVTWPSALPQVPDPFTMYASYPSGPLREIDRLRVAVSDDQITKLWRHEINVLALDVMIPTEEVMKLITYISAKGGVSIGDIFQQYPAYDQEQLWRTVAWVIKLGIVQVH